MISKCFSRVLIAAALIVPAKTTLAQDSGSKSLLEEIIVTARKREESLQDIPIAINTVSSEDILEADISGLEDISNLASGFYFFNQGQNQPGRYNTQLRFRGLNQAQFSPSFETGALFIDGVYVLNGGTSLSLMDIERVEVIKGPQAAYFGRNTFGGAVNFITKDPGMEEFGGRLTASVSDRSKVEVQGFVDGPIIEDRLSGSFAFRHYDKQGHYTASDGGRLGDEQTTTYTAKLLFKPVENLDIKFRYAYSEDDDGAPAQAYIAGRLNDSCSGRTITTPAGETATPINFICGQVPGPRSAIAVRDSRVIDGNTVFTAGVNGGGSTLQEIYSGATVPDNVPFIDYIGMKRETTRYSLHATYNFDNDYTIDFVYGNNEQYQNHIRDFDLSAFPGGFSNDPQALEDESFELRITSPQDGRLRWAAGINRYEQDFTSSLQGGTFMFGCIGTENGNTNSACAPSSDGNGFALLGPFPNSFGQSDKAEVLGIFASIDYDITDQLTFTLEGRQQDDEVTKGGATGPDGTNDSAQVFEFSKFLPRVILRYQPNDGTTLYASYALGVVPGDLNTEFFNADDRERAQYVAQFPTLNETLPQEELTAYELGWKQALFGGAGYMNFSIWQSEWTGIKGRSTGVINESCTASDIATAAPGCSFPGVQVGDGRMELNGAGQLETFFNSRNVLLDGDADLYGFEFEIGGVITEGWTADASIAYVNTEYTRYIYNFGSAVLGFSDVVGLSVPRVPEWSGNLSTTYNFDVNDKLAGFVRGDITYFGESFTEERNLNWTEGYFLTDVRGGVETDKYRVELFISNLFDEDAWASGARFSDTAFPVDFGNFFVQQGVNAAPNDRREVGLRATLNF